MKTKNIIFSLNALEKIVIELEDPIEVVHCCYQCPMSLYVKNEKYAFPDESVRYNMQCFIPLLEQALKEKLFVHNSIENLGYTENEYYQNKPGVVYENGEKRQYWVGDNNHLWSGKGLTVWLYNDSNGSITLEITPVYSYPINDPEDPENYIPYEEWIKGYKSCIKRTIPRDIAQHWLDQACTILSTIEATMKREKTMYENGEGKEIYNEWCKILESEYGITDPRGKESDKVPAEFKTDEWWKKRGL